MGIDQGDIARQRLLRGVLRTGDFWRTEAELAALGGRGHVGVGALRAVKRAGHLRVVWRGGAVEPDVTWDGMWWLVHEYPHSIDGSEPSEWTPMTLVTLGDATAELADWCQALGLCPRAVTRRVAGGEPVLTALERVKHQRLSEPADADVEAFIDDHPHGATLAEVGEVFGVSRERIRQIESQALRKLRGRLPDEVGESIAEVVAGRVSFDDLAVGC